ncbi:MAG: hypothetical protein B6D63_03010 [Candidatus Latescibacteria bacterium 4484_7]|nr:MAG: hypothetical protein B6D63_03010 [Candidatus Latescibacteria bacterium 4484_7]RKZ06428.1 MAG: hypothetical protein DRQ05_04795 [bacterium]
MNEVPKATIGQSGKYLTYSLLLREGIPCTESKNGIDLLVSMKKPVRQFGLLVVSNLRPKKVGGQGKMALDWWVPKNTTADVIACVDLSTLRVWLFSIEEFKNLAQQKTSSKYHLYMYTEKMVALRGEKTFKFDYEFESFRLENKVYRGIFDRKGPKRKYTRKKAAAKISAKTKDKRVNAGKAKAKGKAGTKKAIKAKPKAKAAAKRARKPKKK